MTIQNINKRADRTTVPYIKNITLLILIIGFFSGGSAAQTATTEFTKPSWWFGAAAGANFNFYRGSTQKLNDQLTIPKSFHDGFGAGLYVAPLVEFYRPGSMFGGMLQVGYDSRKGTFSEIITPCNCPAELATKISYLTIEPSLRFAPFRSGFYLFGGPRIAFNLARSFTYSQGTNPEYPSQAPNPDRKGDLSDVNKTLLSMQIGAGYDIPLSAAAKQTQWVLSPFLSFQPYFGQSPRSIETWNVTTLRVGVALKVGRGTALSPKEEAVVVVPAVDVPFTVNSPKNFPVERRVRETFPLRNYVFFDLGSTEIPNRYFILKKSQVKDFNEEQLEVFKPKKLSGRSDRQMIVYYNILNIVGNRMQKDPTATISLVGSSLQGSADALAMAESIKTYLVTVFGIEPSRISTSGREKPVIPSSQPGGTQDRELLAEGERRVSIESTSPGMLMEFQSGPDAPLKPVKLVVDQAPLNSYVTFKADGASKEFTSWSMDITDDKGKTQNFGPYNRDEISIPGKTIMGTRPEGDYKVVMLGKTPDGKIVKKDTTVHMVLWKPAKNEEGMRYSVLFEFNQSKTTNVYEQYLTDIVVPKIPVGATVVIHGYTDVIGDAAHNQALSAARAAEIKEIMEKALAKAGRTDVKFEMHGFGENPDLMPFENTYPEQRFYNRTVVIDILPKE